MDTGLLAGAPQRAILSESDREKNYPGGLARRLSAWRAARLIPTGAGGLNSFAPAALEAVNRYVESPLAGFLDFGFRPVRTIPRRLHFLQQISITSALPRVLGEWPWQIADLAEIRRGKIGPGRFQTYGTGINGTFGPCHDGSKRLNTVRRNSFDLIARSRATHRTA
jgi:hypothetical protein